MLINISHAAQVPARSDAQCTTVREKTSDSLRTGSEVTGPTAARRTARSLVVGIARDPTDRRVEQDQPRGGRQGRGPDRLGIDRRTRALLGEVLRYITRRR